MDQGMYINFIVKEVLSNLLWGALLAMIVLALFLRRIRPTLIVALSIPLSVMFALLLMYFSDITLNVISLSGLGLSVGMLVDNSIVVMENIYRMRSEGVGAVKAAIEGAKEMSAPIISSTLTTICVFVPILFTNGLTRELVMDMCLTVVFSLTASLIVALSVVPTLASTILQNVQPADDRLLDKVKEKYILSFLRGLAAQVSATRAEDNRFRNLLKQGKADQLLKELSISGRSEKARDEFYETFDSTFLGLYPDFVAQFNALLKEEARETPADGRLTTEQRIFALIKLGVDDSKDIAGILDYSLSTIYNYKVAVKNAALKDRDNFEDAVKKIGK
jgi:hypothetical protein